MKKTILLVEDSKVQKLANERILFKAGYLVLFAGDGEEALRLARESVPDLVLLDLLLCPSPSSGKYDSFAIAPDCQRFPNCISFWLNDKCITPSLLISLTYWYNQKPFIIGS